MDLKILCKCFEGQRFKVRKPFRGLEKGDILEVIHNLSYQEDRDFTRREIKVTVKDKNRTLILSPTVETAECLERS